MHLSEELLIEAFDVDEPWLFVEMITSARSGSTSKRRFPWAANRAQAKVMMQNLLVERFKIVLHREMRIFRI